MQTVGALRGVRLIVDGQLLGRIVDISLSDDLKRLDGVWTDSGFGRLRFIDASRICVLGRRSVIADSKGVHLRIKPKTLFIRAVTVSGKRLGAVIDAEIDPSSLNVDRLLISKGLWDSITSGLISTADFRYDRRAGQLVIPDDEIEWRCRDEK